MADIYTITAIPQPGDPLISEGVATDSLLAFHEDIVQRHNMLALNLISLGTTTGNDINIDMSRQPLKTYENNGAHSLIPGPNDGQAIVDIVNGASAGTITLSGWDKITGASFTTTPGAVFRCFVSSIDGVSLLNVDLEGGGGGGGAVDSVNGQTGVVVLDTDDITEALNLYYTDARVIANSAVAANTAKVSANGSINTHSDVDTITTPPMNGQTLSWNNANSEWEPQTPSGTGDMLASVYDPTGVSGDAFQMSNMLGSTTDLSEGTNLYYTEVRVSANINVSANTTKLLGIEAGAEVNTVDSVNGFTGVVVLTTTNINEGTNLYYTDVRVSANTDVSANTTKLLGIEAGAEVNTVDSVNTQTGAVVLSTTNISEGTNLYYTEVRVSANINVSANTTKLLGIESGAEVNTVDSVAGKTGIVTLDTDDVIEASNLYYTEARVTANSAVTANTAKVSADGSIDTHSDVNIVSMPPTNGQVLAWNNVNSEFEPQTVGGVSADMSVATFYDNTGGQILSTARTLINLDTTLTNNGGGLYTLAADQVTIADAGVYLVSFAINVDRNLSTRDAPALFLQRDSGGGFADIAGAKAASYVRDVTPDTVSSNTVILEVAAGDIFQLEAITSIVNSSITVVGGTNLSFVQLKGTKGDVGPAGGVTSVNAKTGVVTLNTSEIPEVTDLYYTEARVTANVSVVANTAKLTANTVNVTAAGALMDSEVDADLKTFVLPANTTISAFGASLIDDILASNARTTLELETISQAEAEAGSSVITRAWTAERVNQAIGALSPVSSVNGQTGVVSLDSDNIGEGVLNLYFTQARVSLNSDVTANNAKVTNATHTGAITGDTATLLGSFTSAQLNTAISDATLTGDNTGDEVAASTTVSGISELATVGEIDAGTDNTRTITPAGLSGSTLQTSVDANNIKLATIETGAQVNTGDVTGPGSSTDNALARFDGTTGKIIQNSSAIVDDSGNLTVSEIVGDGLTVEGTPTNLNPEIRINSETGAKTSFTALQDLTVNNVRLIKVANSGASQIDIDPQPLDGTSGAIVRLFEDTNTSGLMQFQVARGNASNDIDHRLIAGTSGILAEFCRLGGTATVNGVPIFTGDDTDDISEGVTNLYYTETRVSANADVVENTAKVSADGSVATHSDVAFPVAPTNGQALIFNSISGDFEPETIAGIGDMACATFYDSMGGQSLSLTRVVVNLSAQLTNSAPGVFSISTDEITVAETGFYYISYSIVCSLSSGTDSDVQLHLQIDTGTGFEDVISSVASLHVIHDLENTSVHGAVSIALDAADILRLSAQGTVADGTATISGLGTNFNIVQLKGPKGEQGIPGTGTVDTDAIHDNLAGEIILITAKDVPSNFDLLLIEDASDSNNKKRVEIGNLPGGQGIPDAVIRDQKTTSTNGGTFTQGVWQTRDLNTEIRDPDSLISIAANEFTVVNAGWVEWAAPCFDVRENQTRLFNVTDTVVVEYGANTFALDGGGGGGGQVESLGSGAVEATKTYRIEHRCSLTQAGNGFGTGNSFGGVMVYTQVKYWSA